MDWQSHFKTVFFDTWEKAGLPHHGEYINEYIDIREHGEFQNDWINQSQDISPDIDRKQLCSVFGFGVTMGKIFSEMLGLNISQMRNSSDWCGRFNLGISLFDYICDELDGISKVTSLKVFQPFLEKDYSDTRSITPAEELLSNLAGSVLNDLRFPGLKMEENPGKNRLFKRMKQMFEAEDFVSNTNLSAVADLDKINTALYLKSAEPFSVMAEYTALMADAKNQLLINNSRKIGKALGYCYWLIDDAKDVWIDLAAGRWNLFLYLAAVEDPGIFAQNSDVLMKSRLTGIWQQSCQAERMSNQIIKRLVNATRRLGLTEKVKRHTLGLVSASLWQWYNH